MLTAARGVTARRHAASRWPLMVTLLTSIGLHVAAVAMILVLPRGGTSRDGPDKPTEVELVLEERKGDLRAAQPPAAQAPLVPKASAVSESPDKTSEDLVPLPRTRPPLEAVLSLPREIVEPLQESIPSQPAARNPKVDAAGSQGQQAPTVALSGTDSPSEARAWGDRIIPAAPDAVFHNRPPEYPAISAANGEHGTVVLLIHITPGGTAAGVDVVRSSGYALLDRAARQAVSHWRFLPAVKDGLPVPSEMQMGFIFDYE